MVLNLFVHPPVFLVSLFMVQLIASVIVANKKLMWLICGGAIVVNVFIHYLGLMVISPVSSIIALNFWGIKRPQDYRNC